MMAFQKAFVLLYFSKPENLRWTILNIQDIQGCEFVLVQ